jgi:hypothetical protein
VRTTVDIADPLLNHAKRQAEKRGVTLSVVVEDALRAHLTSKAKKDPGPFKLITVKGRLARPDIDINRTSALIVEDDEAQYGPRR